MALTEFLAWLHPYDTSVLFSLYTAALDTHSGPIGFLTTASCCFVLHELLMLILTCILWEQYIRNLKNFRAEQPHQHAVYYTNALAAEQFWTKDELLEATDGKCLPFVVHRDTGYLNTVTLQSAVWILIHISLLYITRVSCKCWQLTCVQLQQKIVAWTYATALWVAKSSKLRIACHLTA